MTRGAQNRSMPVAAQTRRARTIPLSALRQETIEEGSANGGGLCTGSPHLDRAS